LIILLPVAFCAGCPSQPRPLQGWVWPCRLHHAILVVSNETETPKDTFSLTVRSSQDRTRYEEAPGRQNVMLPNHERSHATTLKLALAFWRPYLSDETCMAILTFDAYFGASQIPSKGTASTCSMFRLMMLLKLPRYLELPKTSLGSPRATHDINATRLSMKRSSAR
jgi:hypothetical protein